MHLSYGLESSLFGVWGGGLGRVGVGQFVRPFRSGQTGRLSGLERPRAGELQKSCGYHRTSIGIASARFLGPPDYGMWSTISGQHPERPHRTTAADSCRKPSV